MTAKIQVEQMKPASGIPHWSIAARIAFRFSFVYLGLFIVYFCPLWLQDLLFIKKQSHLVLGGIWPMRQTVFWAGTHIFRMTASPDPGVGYDGSFFWVQAFCLLIISLVASGIWSVLDRRRENYVTLHKWLRLVIRFVLAALMFAYGMFKVIPAQMPHPTLFQLVRPFGHFLQMEVLWAYMGAALSYEIFAGCAELLGGILLLIPRTATFGALVCLADLTNVFVIDMSYNVANKLQVFHFLLLCMFLLAPEFSRLANFFVLNRAAPPSSQPQFFRTLLANRIAMGAQVVLATYLLGANVYATWTNYWLAYADGAPKPVLYGIWDVDQFSMDGEVRPPLLTDNGRFRRVIFDKGIIWELNSISTDDGAAGFQRPDDSLAYYHASINVRDKTLTLTNPDPDPSRKEWKARFTFERPALNQLILDGEMDKHKLHLQLHLLDRKKFGLVSSGFHWVQ
ncbi:MAG TPA: hypothetical protein VEK33_03080 [Terriglobales bacterium]|nr:hypothetical protein [Terriglobales bacterium]